MSEEQQSLLFRPFAQADASITKKFGGTGLGLVISMHIVKLMGGEISVTSEIGEGATFSFSIRAGKSDEKTESSLLAACDVFSDDILILVVDDDDDIREYFVDIALRFNIACDTAASAEEAIDLLKKGHRYDMCFVDWKMPGMNGIELSRHIKKIDDDEPVIIMISAVEWQEIEAEAKDSGINKFLPKPIFPSAFIECINSFFRVDLLNKEQVNKVERIDRFWGYRLLLVEDLDINREIVMALLSPTMLDIDCAENGAEALSMFSENPEKYNVILMDLQMPEMDGYDATCAIRALDCENAKTIPIIAMTANVFKEDVAKCLDVGMDDHLGKPLDFDEVLQVLRRHLYQQTPSKERRSSERRSRRSDRREFPDRRTGDRRKDG